MKQPLFWLLLSCLSGPALAQQWRTEEALGVVKGVPQPGRRVSVQLDNRRVETAWRQHLASQFGSKVKESQGVLSASGVALPEIAPGPLYLVSRVDAGPMGSAVWWRLETDSARMRVPITPSQWLSAEKYLRDFARSLYRDDLTGQIGESERALIATQNNHVALLEKTRQLRAALAQPAAPAPDAAAPTASIAPGAQQDRKQLAQYEREQEAARNDMAHLRLELEAAKQRLSRLE